MNKNLLTYSQFLSDRFNFRKRTDEDLFDIPGHSFFKIMFHFYNGDSESYDKHNGLLAPTWLDNPSEYDYYMYDTAWAYLKNNYEDERADKLEKFITLLSNISSECPWYFQEISGLETALERNQVNDFKFEEARKKIQIKCLPDSHDQKIGTLLSLYREIVWSWTMKREVLPANLRKFDMSLFIWESPVYGVHRGKGDAFLDERSTNEFSASYKLIEFHNCEIDYNSIKTGFSSINNKEGIQNEYTIDISFDDCYEHTYNHVLMESIGDIVAWDISQVSLDMGGNASINYTWDKEVVDKFKNYRKEELENRLLLSRPNAWYNTSLDNTAQDTQVQVGVDADGNPIMNTVSSVGDKYLKGYKYQSDTSGDYQVQVGVDADGNPIMKAVPMMNDKVLEGHKGSRSNGILSNVIKSVTMNAVDEIKTIGNRLLLGNLYTYSISKMASQISNVLKGNPSAALDMIDDYAGVNTMNSIHNNQLNNLASKGQKLLNDHVNGKREGRTGDQTTKLGSISNEITEPKPAASKPYQNSTHDKFQLINSIRKDIFPSVINDQQTKSLGNLNQARTLINNI